jgi:hypothetical protein
VNIKDTDNFARNIKAKLKKWGYGFHYETAAVEILSKPETPEERLAEMLYRGFGISVQIDPIAFACFIAAFTDIERFADNIPWYTRLKLYNEYYGYNFSQDRTLRNWCSQLIDRGVVVKNTCSAKWRTYYADGKKNQEPITEIDEVEMDSYFQRRGEIFKDHYISELERGLPPVAARKAAWKETYTDLWAEFGCCYYYCKGFNISNFSYNDVDLHEIFELCRELAAAAPPPIETKPPPSQSCNDFVF